MALTHDDFVGIQTAFTSALRDPSVRRSLGSGGIFGGGSSTPSGGSSTGVFNTLGNAAAAVSSKLTGLEYTYDTAKRFINDNSQSIKRMSDSGNSYSNDLLAMRNSAIQSRLEFDELSDVLIKHSSNIAGLGGSVTRGSEAFTTLSKEFFKSQMPNELAEMGYSFSEINELLLQQVAVSRHRSMIDAESQLRTYNATAAFAKELDLTAKLTGKSRKQQMEKLQNEENEIKANYALAQLEREHGKVAADRVRNEYLQALAVAERFGVSEMATEGFVKKGAITSETSIGQYTMGGPGAQEFLQIFTDLSNGVVDGIHERLNDASAKMVKQMNDESFQTYVRFNDNLGKFGAPALKLATEGQRIADGVNRLIEVGAKEGKTLTEKDVLPRILDDLQHAQQGQKISYDEKGNKIIEQVDGLNKAFTGLQLRTKEVEAGAAQGLMTSKDGQMSAHDAINYWGGELAHAISTKTSIETPIANFTADVVGAISSTGKAAEQMLSTLHQDLKNLTDKFFPGRATGSLGTTGSLIENFGAGTLTMLHGREGVITEDQLNNIAQGIQTNSVATIAAVFSKASSNLPPDTQDAINNIQPVSNVVNNVKVESQPTNPNEELMKKFQTAFAPPPPAQPHALTQSELDAIKSLTIKDMDKFPDFMNTAMGGKPMSYQEEIDPSTVQEMVDAVAKGTTQGQAVLDYIKSTTKNTSTANIKETISDADLEKIMNATNKYDPSNTFTEDYFEQLKVNVLSAIKEGKGEEVNKYIKMGEIKTASLDKAKTHIQESLNDITVKMSDSLKTEQSIKTAASNNNIASMKTYAEELNNHVASLPFSTLNDNMVDFKNTMSSTFEDLGDTIPVSDIKDNLNTLKDATTNAFKDISNVPPENIQNPVIDFADQMKTSLSNPNLVSAATSAVNSILPAFSDLSMKIGDNVKNISPEFSNIESGFGGLMNGILGTVTQSSQKFNVMITDEFGVTSDNLKKELSKVSPVVEPTPAKQPEISTVAAAPSLDLVNFMGKVADVKSNTDTTKKSENSQEQPKPQPTPEPPKKEVTPEVKPIVQKDNSDAILMQLTLLNKQMSTLIDQHDHYGNKQLKATKSNSGNLMPT